MIAPSRCSYESSYPPGKKAKSYLFLSPSTINTHTHKRELLIHIHPTIAQHVHDVAQPSLRILNLHPTPLLHTRPNIQKSRVKYCTDTPIRDLDQPTLLVARVPVTQIPARLPNIHSQPCQMPPTSPFSIPTSSFIQPNEHSEVPLGQVANVASLLLHPDSAFL
jgi:hypothetical protein